MLRRAAPRSGLGPAGAIFRQANTLQALEHNYRTYQALQRTCAAGPGAAQGPSSSGAAPGAASTSAPAGASSAYAALASGLDNDDDIDMGDGADAMDDDDDDAMTVAGDEGGGGSGPGRGGRRGAARVSPEFKERVMGVLTAGGFEHNRSSKMAQEGFLELLAAFNAAGLHFA